MQWRDLPERYGPRKTVHERHRPWSADGTWETLLRRVQAEADAADEIDWDVSVGSTSVRAHHLRPAPGTIRRPSRHRHRSRIRHLAPFVIARTLPGDRIRRSKSLC
ncbi:transposase [Streptomyces flaveolus]|uniref:transposase n=1 Tax=Streptomyces flaveolus TaxID=67297 RepID=UPI0036FFF2C8